MSTSELLFVLFVSPSHDLEISVAECTAVAAIRLRMRMREFRCAREIVL